MRNFRDIPISRKLVIIVMVTTTAALLMAGLGIVAADSILFRAELRRDLTALTRIVADNITGSLAFNDPKTAAETLASLRARTHVIGACIYRKDGSVLARYARLSSFHCPPPGQGGGIRAEGDHLTASQTAVLEGKPVGTLVLLYDLDELSQRTRLYGSMVLGVVLVSSVVAFLLSTRLRAVIASPVSQLARAATAVSETGDYGIRAEKVSGDELGLLVERFNEMLAGIQSKDSDLKKALAEREAAFLEVEKERERFHFMAESMPQKIFTARANGEIDYYNHQWVEYTGLSGKEIRDWRNVVHPDDIGANIEAWQEAVAAGQPFLYEHRFRRADGQYRWHLTRARPMRDASGRISMWIGSNTEIHEQKEREAELRRANEDLQQFAYSASHDLQEPIRNVAIYSELVAQRYRNLLDDDGKMFLGFLHEGGRRLARLVSDLLAYTRAGVAEIEITAVNAGEVLKHTLAALAEAMRESDATVTSDELPEVYMSEAHLQQVLQNLISNALKYRTDEPPKIHVSAAKRGAAWCLAVRDNGIGIDPRYKERIFGVFKRLHHDQRYGGTGIGLAICQRVVERYGGRIWVESEPGNGATFYFTVPQHARTVRSATV
ncbi:MAG TPA: ATP-binding protein [Bryobacteraceae bacterium]|nr:ATP-binding protein [Bryobacteraceae bacterium]